jgi:hypothetical protein
MIVESLDHALYRVSVVRWYLKARARRPSNNRPTPRNSDRPGVKYRAINDHHIFCIWSAGLAKDVDLRECLPQKVEAYSRTAGTKDKEEDRHTFQPLPVIIGFEVLQE